MKTIDTTKTEPTEQEKDMVYWWLSVHGLKIDTTRRVKGGMNVYFHDKNGDKTKIFISNLDIAQRNINLHRERIKSMQFNKYVIKFSVYGNQKMLIAKLRDGEADTAFHFLRKRNIGVVSGNTISVQALPLYIEEKTKEAKE